MEESLVSKNPSTSQAPDMEDGGTNALNMKTRLHFLHGEDPSHNFYRYASNTQKAWSICSFITVLLKFCGGSHIGPLIPRLLYPFNMAEWVNLIIRPEIQLGLEGHQARGFTLFAAILSETIWFHRNQTVHKAIPLDIHVLINTLRQRYREHACAWTDNDFRSNQRWVPPSPNPHGILTVMLLAEAVNPSSQWFAETPLARLSLRGQIVFSPLIPCWQNSHPLY